MPVEPAPLPAATAEFLARGLHADPFAVLGPHETTLDADRGLVIRVFRPHVSEVTVLSLADGRSIPMKRVHAEGVFEAFVPGATREQYDYRLRLIWPDGSESVIDDPFRYGPVLTTFDQHLFGEGTHVRAFDRLGARPMVHG